MGWESFDVVTFGLGHLFQSQMRTAKLKSAYNLLIIGPRALHCETNLLETMGCVSSDVLRFDRYDKCVCADTQKTPIIFTSILVERE